MTLAENRNNTPSATVSQMKVTECRKTIKRARQHEAIDLTRKRSREITA